MLAEHSSYRSHNGSLQIVRLSCFHGLCDFIWVAAMPTVLHDWIYIGGNAYDEYTFVARPNRPCTARPMTHADVPRQCLPYGVAAFFATAASTRTRWALPCAPAISPSEPGSIVAIVHAVSTPSGTELGHIDPRLPGQPFLPALPTRRLDCA
jgi:hypothetical protein